MISLLAATLISLASPNPSNGVPQPLLSRLTTGVNITRWFCYLGADANDAHFANYLKEADYKNFSRIGAKFVRLCVSPDFIYSNGKPSANLAKIDVALSQLKRRKIAVIWDLHDNGQLGLDKPGSNAAGLVSFWSSLAKHYKGKYGTDVVFEVVNEPVFRDKPNDWYKLQAKVVPAIRKEDPKRTIMVSPTSWSGIDSLKTMAVLPEKNLVYTFHCYDPFLFSHQGAEWVGDIPKNLNSLPFPSSPEAVQAVTGKNDAKYAGTLQDYGKQRFDAQYLDARLKIAVDWGNRNQVPVLLGEFGIYPKVAPVDSRARWFEAMKAAISRYKLPNAIWGYDDGLGLGRRLNADGSVWVDENVLTHFYKVKP